MTGDISDVPTLSFSAMWLLFLIWLVPTVFAEVKSDLDRGNLVNEFNKTININRQDYKPGWKKKWTLVKSPEKLLNFTVNVTRMSIEESVNCKADSLVIEDRHERSLIWGPLCRKLSEDEFITRWFVNFGLSITFRTDTSYEYDGFTLEITGDIPDVGYVCDLMHDREAKTIISNITSTEGRIPEGVDCTWDLAVNNSSWFLITVEEMDIEYSGTNCVYDRIEIVENGETRHFLCGRQSNKTILVRSNQVGIKFHSDLGEDRHGFFITYEEKNKYDSNPAKTERRTFVSTEPMYEPLFLRNTDLQDKQKQIWTFRTHPGFVIQLEFWKPVDEAIVIHDGPSRSFRELDFSELSNIAKSTGFHAVLELDASLDVIWISSNVTFRAVHDMNEFNTSVAYFGPSNFFVANRTFSNHIIYLKLLVDEGHYVRPHLIKSRNILPERPNTDNCFEAGIVLYDTSVESENVLGPFCDIADGYASSVLSKLVGSSNTMYVVMYDYADKDKRWSFNSMKATAANCPGYPVTDVTFLEQRIWVSKPFNTSAHVENNINTLTIHTDERYFKCMVVMYLPEFIVSKAFNVVLTGPLEYRTCFRWNLKDKSYSTPKYDQHETCTKRITVRSGMRTTVPVHAERSHWAIENSWIEIGAVEENICYDVHVDVVDWTCGVISSIEKEYQWHIKRPSNDTGYWIVNVDLLLAKRKKHGAIITLAEITPDKKFRMDLSVSNFKIGQLRSFVFRSRVNMNLKIKSQGVRELILRFEYKSDTTSWVSPDHLKSSIGGYTNRYSLHRCNSSWLAARRVCDMQGGRLVSINTVAELDYLKTRLAQWMNVEDFHECVIYIGLSDSEKLGMHRWEDGTPVTVTDWYYNFAALDNVVGKTMLNGEEKDTYIEPDKMQPFRKSDRCVAMVPTNLYYSTNWRKINCRNMPPVKNLFVICESWNHTAEREEREDQPIEALGKDAGLTCKRNWTFVDNTCLAVLTADMPRSISLQPDRAREMCIQYGGLQMKIGKLGRLRLKSHLLSLGFENDLSGFRVTLESGKDGCITMPILQSEEAYMKQIQKSTNTCSMMTNVPSHTICESKPVHYVPSCEDFLFNCKNGECLAPDYVCDGIKHCSNGYDEDICPDLKVDVKFKCDDGRKIPISRYCDFTLHCRGDEVGCVRPPCNDDEFRCTNGLCIPKKQHCDGKSHCFDRSDEKSCTGVKKCKAFVCPLEGCVENRHVNDLQADCPDSTQGDEKKNFYPNKTHRSFTFYDEKFKVVDRLMNDCPGSIDQQRCHVDHIKCYPRSEACILNYDEDEMMTNCRNGAHLRHCADFQCPEMFKCKESYCIPRPKVCDGKKDCIHGEDELACQVHTCRNELKCTQSSVCVPKQFVCDGIRHCIHGDDERFCDMKDTVCPNNCICLGYSVKCWGKVYKDVPSFKYRSNIRILDLSNNTLQLNNESFAKYYQLMTLLLRGSHISHLVPGTFNEIPNLLLLDLRENKLEVLKAQTFVGLKKLKTIELTGNPLKSFEPGCFIDLVEIDILNLSGMKIKALSENTFSNMKRLEQLNLSYNEINSIHANVFTSIPNLNKIYLQGNPMLATKDKPFVGLKLSYIDTGSYRFCCYISDNDNVGQCEPKNDVFSSCSSLLGDDLVIIAMWFYACTILLGNLTLLIWFAFWKVADASSVFALNLAIPQLTLGISYWMIVLVDLKYKGDFVEKDVEWRQTSSCKTIGFLAVLGSQKAMYSVVCISVDKATRLTGRGPQITKKVAWGIDALGWPLCLLTATAPLVAAGYFELSYYSRNTLCLPLNFHEFPSPGWEESTAVNVAFIVVCLLIISAMNVLLSYVGDIYKEENCDHFDPQLDTVRRCSYLLTTNVCIMCLILLCTFLTLIGHGLSLQIGSTVQAVFLPMAASLNPIIYVLNSFQSKRLAKYIVKYG